MGAIALRRQQQTTEVEMISPEMAEKYLEANTHNRNVSDATVEALAAEMIAGRWRLHHQGIAFDAEGVLRDGQHRLWAITVSQKTVPMLVTRGIDAAVFDTIDAHRPRKVGEQLKLVHNLPAGLRIAAAATVINTIEQDKGFGRRIAIGLTLDIFKRHKDGIEFSVANLPSGPFSKAPITGPIAFAFGTNREKAAAFAKQVRDGERLTKKDPASALRALIINTTASMSSTLDRRTIAVATLRCLHAFFEGEALGAIRRNQLVDSETYAKARRYFMKASKR